MNELAPNCSAVPDVFPVLNRGNMPAGEFDSLAQIVRGHRSIKHALDWLLPQGFAPLDSIAQDEYSHDVLFPFRNPYWLVYECT